MGEENGQAQNHGGDWKSEIAAELDAEGGEDSGGGDAGGDDRGSAGSGGSGPGAQGVDGGDAAKDAASVDELAAPAAKPESEAKLWRRIADQDKEVRQLRAAAKAAESAVKWREQITAQARVSPIDAARALGITAESLIAAYAGMPDAEAARPHDQHAALPREVQERLAKIEAVEARQAALEARLESDLLAGVREQQRASISRMIADAGESYALVADAGQAGVDLVLEVASEIAEARGIKVTTANIGKLYQAALPAVEEHYAEQHRATADRVRRNRRLAGMYGVAAGEPQPARPSTASAVAARADTRVPSEGGWSREDTLREVLRGE